MKCVKMPRLGFQNINLLMLKIHLKTILTLKQEEDKQKYYSKNKNSNFYEWKIEQGINLSIMESLGTIFHQVF